MYTDSQWWGMCVAKLYDCIYVDYYGGIDGGFVESTYTITPPVLPQDGVEHER